MESDRLAAVFVVCGGGTTATGTFTEPVPAAPADAFTGTIGLVAAGDTFTEDAGTGAGTLAPGETALFPRAATIGVDASVRVAADAPAGGRAVVASAGCFVEAPRGAPFFPDAAILGAGFTGGGLIGGTFSDVFTTATTGSLGATIGPPADFEVAALLGGAFWTDCFASAGGGTDFVDPTCF